MFERGADAVGIGRAGDSNAYAAYLDIDRARVLTVWLCLRLALLDVTGINDSCRQELCCRRLHVQQSFAIQLPPLKHLVGIDAV